MVTAGIMIAYMFGFTVPYEYKTNDTTARNPDINTTEVYRLIILVHAVVSFVQVGLVLTVFNKDTPKYYRQINREDEAKATEQLIYIEIHSGSDSEPDSTNDANNGGQNQADNREAVIPFVEHFTDMYRTAFFIA